MGVSKHLFKHSYIDIGECYPWWLSGKESACSAGDADSIPKSEDPLEEGMATHSSILAWRIPQTEEPGRLQSIGSCRVGYSLGDFSAPHIDIKGRKKGGR